MPKDRVRGNFFNEDQRNIKEKISEKCLSAFFDTLRDNLEVFGNDAQVMSDLFGSLLIIINREIMSVYFGLIHEMNAEKRNKVMGLLFDSIKVEVARKLKSIEKMKDAVNSGLKVH